MSGLIQAAEIWVPDEQQTLLEFGAGWYDQVPEFGVLSASMCFGRAEGLPGRAWDQGQPIVLDEWQQGYFRRAAAAQRAGLTCAVALPCYCDDQFKAVLVLFLGGEHREDGAVELWRNDSRITTDMTCVSGHYGATAQTLLAEAREAFLPRGFGLPGLAWQREGSVFMDGVSSSRKFLRAEAADAAGIRHGLALPCAVPGNLHHVLTLFGTAHAPIARRLESWAPAGDGVWQRAYGQSEQEGVLPVGVGAEVLGAGQTVLQQAISTATPQIWQEVPGGNALLALPLCTGAAVDEVMLLQF